MYRIFTRTWWKSNKSWPNGLEPHMGRKTTIAHVDTYAAAADFCRVYNVNHAPGRLGRKAEFEQA